MDAVGRGKQNGSSFLLAVTRGVDTLREWRSGRNRRTETRMASLLKTAAAVRDKMSLDQLHFMAGKSMRRLAFLRKSAVRYGFEQELPSFEQSLTDLRRRIVVRVAKIARVARRNFEENVEDV